VTVTAKLEVRFGAIVVGTVRVDEGGRFCFAYDPTWCTRGDRFPVSLTLPISSHEYVDGPAHTFFVNLLPEGAVRQTICARLGISADNDFALLQAIGGECAGALSLIDPARPSADPDDFSYEELQHKQLQSLVAADAIPLLIGGPKTRLSLAGAQDKLPVALLDGKLHLPLNAAPSTHILKLPNPRYPQLPANEAFALGLARQLGFEVVRGELFTGTDPPSLLVARYDRAPSDDPWPVRRIHQEDLCQATGLPPTRKYEAEGGLSLAGAVTVIRDHVTRPLVDVPRVISWQAFNIVLGNSDGHAKNLSILYTDNDVKLAPLYDLVSTREYKRLDRKLAMGVGGRQNPDEIERPEWLGLSEELRIGQRTVLDLVRGVAQQSLDALPGWTREFRDSYGDQPILQTLPRAITRRARRVLRALDA
jgi:serine/threonine-protein kinase HipA